MSSNRVRRFMKCPLTVQRLPFAGFHRYVQKTQQQQIKTTKKTDLLVGLSHEQKRSTVYRRKAHRVEMAAASSGVAHASSRKTPLDPAVAIGVAVRRWTMSWTTAPDSTPLRKTTPTTATTSETETETETTTTATLRRLDASASAARLGFRWRVEFEELRANG